MVSIYPSQWGLREPPFRRGITRHSFHASPSHEEALARLDFLVRNQQRVGVLTGATGLGKSSVLQLFCQQTRRRGFGAALVRLLAVGSRDLLWSVAAELGLNPPDHAPEFVLWRRIADRIAENRLQKLPTVLLFDDADEAAPETLSTVVRLLHADCAPDARLTGVLAVRPDRLARLGPRLLDLCELRIDLEPWDESDTVRFVADNLRRVGGKAELFEPRAAARLYELTGGVPRHVNQLAELALLAAASQHSERVDRHTVDCVYDELALVAQGHAVPA